MLASLAASGAAARALHYPGLASLIEEDGIGPAQLLALLRLSASKTAARDYCVIILASSIGRYRACQQGWTAEPERSLALTALADEPDPQAAYLKLSDQAAKLVKAHWREIRQAAAT